MVLRGANDRILQSPESRIAAVHWAELSPGAGRKVELDSSDETMLLLVLSDRVE